jgi:maleylacetoacetate isomerase
MPQQRSKAFQMSVGEKRERETGAGKRVLLNYWRSSCSWRVRMALHAKGLEYEYKPVNLLKGEDCAPDYWQMNPSGVPTLLDDGNTVTQSLAILEYLEERYPQNPLLPRAFADRATVRSIALLIASGIQPLQNLGVAQKIAKNYGDEHKMPWLKEVISEGMAGLEAVLSKHAGKCCFGDEFTIADATLIPQAYAARRFGVDLSVYPTVSRVLAHIEALDVAKATHPDNMPDAVKQ